MVTATSTGRCRQDYSWQDHVITTYRRDRQRLADQMATGLAARIYHLTGCAVAPQSIHVDREAAAAVRVGGVLFRLQQGNLVVVRSCVVCGSADCASRPITDLASLGYALSDWQPRCDQCPPEDENSADW